VLSAVHCTYRCTPDGSGECPGACVSLGGGGRTRRRIAVLVFGFCASRAAGEQVIRMELHTNIACLRASSCPAPVPAGFPTVSGPIPCKSPARMHRRSCWCLPRSRTHRTPHLRLSVQVGTDRDRQRVWSQRGCYDGVRRLCTSRGAEYTVDNVLLLGQYLCGGVPYEGASEWCDEMPKVQAVRRARGRSPAAEDIALGIRRARRRALPRVAGGTRSQHARVRQAVLAPSGCIVVDSAHPTLAYYTTTMRPAAAVSKMPEEWDDPRRTAGVW